MSDVRVKNLGSNLVVTVGGTDYTFPGGDTVTVSEDVGKVAQYRHGVQLQIVTEPPAEGEPEPEPAETVQDVSEKSALRQQLERTARELLATTQALKTKEAEAETARDALAQAEAELAKVRAEADSDALALRVKELEAELEKAQAAAGPAPTDPPAVATDVPPAPSDPAVTTEPVKE